MNWALQLAAGMTAEERPLLDGVERSNALVQERRYGDALGVLWGLLFELPKRRAGRSRAFLVLHMGHVYRHWMCDVAAKLFGDGRDLSREAGFRRGEMVAESSLGMIYRDWRDARRALVHFERALELAWACAGPSWQRDLLIEVIVCLRSLGLAERAWGLEGRLRELDRRIDEELEVESEPVVRPPRSARPRWVDMSKGERSCWS